MENFSAFCYFFPMTALILDTSQETGFAALSSKTTLLRSVPLQSKSFLEYLVPLLEELQKEGIALDYLAIGAGPGSYTGTRTGAAFAKAFAFARNLPLIGFDSPLAYLPKGAGRFAALIPGKRDDHCLIQGEKREDAILAHSAPSLIPNEALAKVCSEIPLIVTCDNFSLNLPPLLALLDQRFQSGGNHPPEKISLTYLYEILPPEANS